MADGGYDPSFGMDDSFLDQGWTDPAAIATSTDPSTPAIIPGADDGGDSGSSVGPDQGATFSSADNLYAADTPNPDQNTQSFDDGSSIVTDQDGTQHYFDANGDELSVLSINDDGTLNLSDGSVVDPKTGDWWNADNSDKQLSPDSGAQAARNAASSGGSSGSSGFPAGGKGGGGSQPSNSAATQTAAALSKTLGNIGAALASLLGKPSQPTPAQRKINTQTPLGQASILTSSGTAVLVAAAIVVIIVMARGK